MSSSRWPRPGLLCLWRSRGAGADASLVLVFSDREIHLHRAMSRLVGLRTKRHRPTAEVLICVTVGRLARKMARLLPSRAPRSVFGAQSTRNTTCGSALVLPLRWIGAHGIPFAGVQHGRGS